MPAAIAALVLFATGLLIAVETISALFGRPVRIVPYERVAAWASASTWQDNAVMAGAGIIGIVGLLLVLIGMVSGRSRLVPLRSSDPDMIITTPRRMLARVLGTVAAQVDGVRQAWAKVRGRRVTVRSGHRPARHGRTARAPTGRRGKRAGRARAGRPLHGQDQGERCTMNRGRAFGRGIAWVNRTGLVVLGLILFAAGAAASARGLGVFGANAARAPLLPSPVSTFAGSTSWFWPAVAAGGVVVGVIGAGLAARSVPTRPAGSHAPGVRPVRGHRDRRQAGRRGPGRSG